MEKINWKQAEDWEKKANEDKDKYDHVVWSWDCNFKLNYDGQLLKISSRFYPPAFKYGPNWDGKVHIYMGEQEIHSKQFDCETLDQLKKEVEYYVECVQKTVSNIIYENLVRIRCDRYRDFKGNWFDKLLNRIGIC